MRDVYFYVSDNDLELVMGDVITRQCKQYAFLGCTTDLLTTIDLHFYGYYKEEGAKMSIYHDNVLTFSELHQLMDDGAETTIYSSCDNFSTFFLDKVKKHNFGFKKSTRKIPQVAEISSSLISTQHKFQLPAKGKKLKESQTVAQPVTESDFNKFKDEILEN